MFAGHANPPHFVPEFTDARRGKGTTTNHITLRVAPTMSRKGDKPRCVACDPRRSSRLKIFTIRMVSRQVKALSNSQCDELWFFSQRSLKGIRVVIVP